jgi:hypothetical protein
MGHYMDIPIVVLLVIFVVVLLRVKIVVSLCGCFLDAVCVGIRGSVCVGMNGIVWMLGACGGGVLILVGFQKRVKDLVVGDSRVIV